MNRAFRTTANESLIERLHDTEDSLVVTHQEPGPRQMATSPILRSNVLNSWKEIASYLGRGVRTAQRWEHDFAMPVRRPGAKSRCTVAALPEEIDAWLRRAPYHELKRSAESARPLDSRALRASIEQSEQLRERCQALRNEHHLVLIDLLDKLDAMTISLNANGGAEAQKCGGRRQHERLKYQPTFLRVSLLPSS